MKRVGGAMAFLFGKYFQQYMINILLLHQKHLKCDTIDMFNSFLGGIFIILHKCSSICTQAY